VGYSEEDGERSRPPSVPYSVVLFDEIEKKAHPDVFNLLPVEDGRLAMQGPLHRFKNTFDDYDINVGSQVIEGGGGLGTMRIQLITEYSISRS